MIKSKILFGFKKYKYPLGILFSLAVMVSCANMASPGGGDYDYDPPKVVRSSPAFNVTNYTGTKIEIVFDELVQLEKPMEKVIVTPPQKRLPVIQAISNKVKVELRDTLLPNTTYIVDFTDAVADYNEKNVLENFVFSFSTGDVIDSLAVSGKVLTADNLEPVKGIYVGLHSNLNDTAFTKIRFDRISRTNERGEFTVKGISEGKYRIYALDDINRDYMYDNPAEAIAFFDSIVVPSYTQAFRTDTIYKKDLTVDTVMSIPYTKFLPNNIVLKSFMSDFKRQYLQKTERTTANQMKIFFGAPTEMPKVTPLNFTDSPDWSVLERSRGNDTLQYWIVDPRIVQMDTLTFEVAYHKSDSLNQPVWTTDTLNFINRSRRTREKDDKKDKDKEDIKFLRIDTNLKGIMNVYDPINIVFDQPVKDSIENKFYLQRLVDSTYVDEEIKFVRDSLNPRKYTMRHRWRPEGEYLFTADSAAIYSYTDLWNDKLEAKFKIKALNEYGRLYISISGLNTDSPVYVELLNSSDVPVRKGMIRDGGVGFSNIDPGNYYARLFIDENRNGVWDTGDYNKKRQPEQVYYYNKYFEIKANWDLEEAWNVTALDIDKQKPLEITKNKPQEKETKRQQMEKRDQQEQKQKRQQEQSLEEQQNYGRSSMSY